MLKQATSVGYSVSAPPNNLYGLCSAVGNTPSPNTKWQWTPALQQAGSRQRHPCADPHASLETFPVMTPPPPTPLAAPSFQAVASRGKVASLETDTASFSQVSAFLQGPDWCVLTRTWYRIKSARVVYFHVLSLIRIQLFIENVCNITMASHTSIKHRSLIWHTNIILPPEWWKTERFWNSESTGKKTGNSLATQNT